jgi:hypothetical protein
LDYYYYYYYYYLAMPLRAMDCYVPEIVDGNVRGNIIPVGSSACNYLKFAGELARKA